MSNRINLEQVWPRGYSAMLALSQASKPDVLTTQQVELIKIRASQINSCAFCIDLHTKAARNVGEAEQRIHVLSAWRQTSFFTEAEKAMLALAEEITLVHRDISTETYNKAARILTQEQIAEVILTTAVINAWNRVVKATGLQPSI